MNERLASDRSIDDVADHSHDRVPWRVRCGNAPLDALANGIFTRPETRGQAGTDDNAETVLRELVGRDRTAANYRDTIRLEIIAVNPRHGEAWRHATGFARPLGRERPPLAV